MQPHKPKTLVVPELKYERITLLPEGKPPRPLGEAETKLFKRLVWFTVDEALERMRCANT